VADLKKVRKNKLWIFGENFVCTLAYCKWRAAPPGLKPAARPKRQHGSACVLARCGVQSSGISVALWPTCVVLIRYVSTLVARRAPRGLPSPRIFMFLGGMQAASSVG